MTPNVLVNLNFGRLIAEASACTQTGAELITKYQTHLMANAESCAVVNQFVREAVQHVYDNGVHEALETVSDYINMNKTSWALASACESIQNRANIFERSAAKQVEKLLEQEEDEVVKYIRAGALKNVMYCEAFRNIAKAVYADKPVIEHKAEYTKVTPCSFVESVGDGYCFVVAGQLYKMDDARNISEALWSEVSNTFKTVSSLLNSNLVSIDEKSVTVDYNNIEYVIENNEGVTKYQGAEKRELTIEQFRDQARLAVMAANPRHRNQLAGVMEAIALLAENYDNVVTLDHVGIYTTQNDKFVVIESGDTNLYATLLSSSRQPRWTVNEDAVKTLSFIKAKTNTELGEEYKSIVEHVMEAETEKHRADMEQELRENEEKSIKDRIAALTEKFKNDPTKLAVLAKLAAETQEL